MTDRAAAGTTRDVLRETKFITKILLRELQQGCDVKLGAGDRIEAAIIAAVEAEIVCKVAA